MADDTCCNERPQSIGIETPVEHKVVGSAPSYTISRSIRERSNDTIDIGRMEFRALFRKYMHDNPAQVFLDLLHFVPERLMFPVNGTSDENVLPHVFE